MMVILTLNGLMNFFCGIAKCIKKTTFKYFGHFGVEEDEVNGSLE